MERRKFLKMAGIGIGILAAPGLPSSNYRVHTWDELSPYSRIDAEIFINAIEGMGEYELILWENYLFSVGIETKKG